MQSIFSATRHCLQKGSCFKLKVIHQQKQLHIQNKKKEFYNYEPWSDKQNYVQIIKTLRNTLDAPETGA